MVDAVELYLKGWKPRGRRLVVISNSGATCVMAADAATAAGLPMARLADDTQAGLRAVLPSFAATANPVDITAALLSNSRLFSQILPIIARDAAADAFLIGVPVAGAAYDVPVFARDAAAFAAETGKPVVVSAPQASVAAPFAAAGLPVFAYETQAVAALAGFIAHAELTAATRPPPEASAPAAPIGQGRPLNEADSLRRLSQAGVPVMPHRLCLTEDEAGAALEAFGGAVAVKGCSAEVTHKSELGLVRLGLADPQAVRAAFRDCQRILSEAVLSFEGVLVAPMRRGRREMMLGAHRDPVFGPVVLIGDGGKYVEALPDTVLLLPPFDVADALAALDRLRIAPVLRGVRGEKAMDVEALAAAAVAVGLLMLEAPSLVSLDINPLLVGDVGEGVVALDAVVIEAAPTTEETAA
jgi:acyl-CoA synthetase (NDP forming)